MSKKEVRNHQIIPLRDGAEKTANGRRNETSHNLKQGSTFQSKTHTVVAYEEARAKELAEEIIGVLVTTVPARLQFTLDGYREWINLESAINLTNTKAKATVMMDGKEWLPDLPVTTLLFLEKFGASWLAVIDDVIKYGVRASTTEWVPDPDHVLRGVHKSKRPRVEVKKEKTAYVLEITKQTDKQQGTGQVLYRDVGIADITDILYTGQISAAEANDLSETAKKFLNAVKMAREEANQEVVVNMDIADKIFGFLMTGKTE